MAGKEHQDISIAAGTSTEITVPIPLKGMWILQGVALNVASKSGSAATGVLYIGTTAAFTIRSKEQIYESDSVSLASLPVNNDDMGQTVERYFIAPTNKTLYVRLVINASDTVAATVSIYMTSKTDGV